MNLLLCYIFSNSNVLCGSTLGVWTGRLHNWTRDVHRLKLSLPMINICKMLIPVCGYKPNHRKMGGAGVFKYRSLTPCNPLLLNPSSASACCDVWTTWLPGSREREQWGSGFRFTLKHLTESNYKERTALSLCLNQINIRSILHSWTLSCICSLSTSLVLNNCQMSNSWSHCNIKYSIGCCQILLLYY